MSLTLHVRSLPGSSRTTLMGDVKCVPKCVQNVGQSTQRGADVLYRETFSAHK